MTNLLILTPQLPYPPHQGTSLRNFHIIRGLAARYDITLLSFLEDNQTADPEANEPLFSLCQHIVTTPVPPRTKGKRLQQMGTTRLPDMAHRLYSPDFEVKLRQLLAEKQFDIVQVEGIELARYISTVRQLSPASKLVFDDHNAEAELQRRNMETDAAMPKRWPAAAYSWVQVGRLQMFEAWACAEADWVTAVSEADVAHLKNLLQRKGAKAQRKTKSAVTKSVKYVKSVDDSIFITAIPNCIDVTQYALPEDNSSLIPHLSSFDLVFSGKMDYRPNIDAVLWFADAVWPKILAQRPLATWAIVGQKPHARLERLRDVDGITVTGWVDSVQPYLAGAGVYIMPFRVGSGTRLKLIEAMAAGLAIVSTRIGAEGFPVANGREIVLADTEDEMVTAVLHLLDNPAERAQIGQQAVQFAQNYDWRVVIPQFEAIYTRLLNDD
jgi:glycosyltransferase involved in cell wall biosynthesis